MKSKGRGEGDETEGATEQKQQIKAQTARALPHNRKKRNKANDIDEWCSQWWMDGWMSEWMND